MSTDNEMDELLRGAGTRWRAANPGSTTTVDFETPRGTDRRNRWLIAAAASVVVAAVGVGGTWLGTHHDRHQGAGPLASPPETHHGLIGTHWQLLFATSASSNSAPDATASGYPALDIKADGTMIASDGCNTISGPAAVDDSTIRFGDLVSTTIACVDAGVAARASILDNVLLGTVTWSIADTGAVPVSGSTRLTITSPTGGTLVYEGQRPEQPPATDPAKMVGTWQLVELDLTSGLSSSGQSAYRELLVIAADGTFKVQNRCYAEAGSVAIGEGSATWSGLHTVGTVPCPATGSQQDEQKVNSAVDGVLTGATTWAVTTSGDLTITKDGTKLIYAPYASDSTSGGSGTN